MENVIDFENFSVSDTGMVSIFCPYRAVGERDGRFFVSFYTEEKKFIFAVGVGDKSTAIDIAQCGAAELRDDTGNSR